MADCQLHVFGGAPDEKLGGTRPHRSPWYLRLWILVTTLVTYAMRVC
jgi:hypothetical protein